MVGCHSIHGSFCNGARYHPISNLLELTASHLCAVYADMHIANLMTLYVNKQGPHWDTIKQFGLVSIDWSNARSKWAATTPMTCEEDLLKQAEIVKAADTLGPQQRVFVYRNTVIVRIEGGEGGRGRKGLCTGNEYCY